MEVLTYPHHQLQGGLNSDITPRCLFGIQPVVAGVSEETTGDQETLPSGEVEENTPQNQADDHKREEDTQNNHDKDEKDSDVKESLCTLQNRTSPNQKEQNQIAYLESCIPTLGNLFHLHRKIGEGTFSSVFLATLKNVPAGSPFANQQFAVKHLIPTTHPSRVERELRCLQEIGGCENVVGVNWCIRNLDNIAFIMPYLPHRRFSEYVIEMGVTETRNYMKQLLRALRRVHSFSIIHRDVKPSNFLYDRESKQFLLVDFGLSQSVEETLKGSSSPVQQGPGKKRKRDSDYVELAKTSSCDSSDNLAKRPALAPHNFIRALKTPEKSQKISADTDCGQSLLYSNRVKGLQNITNVNGFGYNSQKQTSISSSLRRIHKSPVKEVTDNIPLKKTPRKNKNIAKENALSPPKFEHRVIPKKSNVFFTSDIYQDGYSPNISKCALDLRKTKHDGDLKLKLTLHSPGIPSSLQRKINFDDCPDDKVKSENENRVSFTSHDVKHPPFARRSLARLSNYSPGSPLPVSGVFPSPGESDLSSPACPSPDQITSSSKEFRTLVPERGKDVAAGSSLIRVQYSQMSPITPRDTKKISTHHDQGYDKCNKNVIFAKPQAPLTSGSVHRTSTPSSPRCTCFGRPQVCAVCMSRKANNAPRAGTPGFRPPEVLLRSPFQSTAVDMWAVGVILLCILSGCYPFFRSPDDLTALAEIMTVFGTDKIKETATRLGRMVVCSQPSHPLDLKKLCTRMRQRRKSRLSSNSVVKDSSDDKCKNCYQRLGIPDSCLCQKDTKDAFFIDPTEINNIEESDDVFPDSAYHLLARLLDLNAETRITAAQALEHPFVSI